MLNNKVIIVTGGSGLLGKQIIKEIEINNGIAINFDIFNFKDDDECFFKCDITSEKSMITNVEKVIKKFKKINGLVNNAYPRTKDWGNKLEDVLAESWKKNMDIQTTGVFFLTKIVIEEMLKVNTSPSIVNIASIYGVVGNDFTVYEGTNLVSPPVYSYIKGGLINYTRYLASYFGRKGIRVNTVSPGGIFDNQNPIFVENYNKKVPLGRMGKPEEIAPIVSFLLSSKASYITGQNVIVDGGWTCI